MRTPGNFLFDDRPHRINLLVWDGQRMPSRSDESKETFCAKDFCALLWGHCHVDEYVTGEKRNFDFLAAVAPAMHFGHNRTECADSLLVQPVLDYSLVTRARMQRIPVFAIGRWCKTRLSRKCL